MTVSFDISIIIMVLGILMIILGLFLIEDAFFSNAGTNLEGDPESDAYYQSVEHGGSILLTPILGFFMFIIGLVVALILRRK